MLRHNPTVEQDPDHVDRDVSISFEEVVGIARRQAWLVVIVGILGAGFGLSYALTATPLYTATTKVIIDNPASQLSQLNPFGEMGTDNATILSQVEMIRSEKVVGAVVDRFDLARPSSASQSEDGFISRVTEWFSLVIAAPFAQEEATAALEADEGVARSRAVRRVSRALEVKRLGMTYILNIQFTDPSPARAADVANGFAAAYLEELVSVRLESARQAREWLKQQIKELAREAELADLEVQKFRSQNKVVAVDGRRVDEQQLSELNSSLVAAIGAASQAEAKFNRIEQIIASGDLRSLVTEALGSNIITDLRQKYLAVDKQAQELEALVGKSHVRVLALREEMRRYEEQIFEELQRIRESTRSELAIARRGQADLDARVKAMSSVSGQNNETLVALRAIEDRASTARQMLQTLLSRDQEAQQGQSFSMSESRVIAAATAPVAPSYPRKQLFALAGLLLGLVGGAGLGYLREVSDRGFRYASQVQKLLGLPLISAVPMLSEDKASRRNSKSNLSTAGAGPEQAAADVDGASDRIVDYAVRAPMSGFAEALRSVKMSVDLAAPSEGGCVVGFVSSFPGEGKSTLAKNFASLLALSGYRTIVIDADLRAHGLTRYVDRDNAEGLVEVLEGRYSFDQVLRSERSSGLDIMLAVIGRRIFNSAELLSSRPMKALLETLRLRYDYIILDLPPLGPVVDAKAVAPRVDALVMVVEWGVTPRYSVKSLLTAQEPVQERCVGIVFNKVDMDKIHRYDSYGVNDYGYSKYGNSRGYQNYYAEEESRSRVRPARRGLAAWLGNGVGALRGNRRRTAPSRGEVVIGRRGADPDQKHEGGAGNGGRPGVRNDVGPR
jgi:succinoglycan biosynthesis transport protein ExoP